MRGVVRSALVVAVVGMLGAVPARAQGLDLGIGATALVGIGNGGGSSAGLLGTIGSGRGQLSFRGDLGVFLESGTPLMATAHVVYAVRAASAATVRPYLLAGAGYVTSTSDFGSGDLLVGAGVGAKMVLTSVTLFGEARLLNQFAAGGSVQALQLSAGVSLPLGGK
jgi:hypothetical protein